MRIAIVYVNVLECQEHEGDTMAGHKNTAVLTIDTIDQGEFLSVEEVADHLRVSTKTVRALLAGGKLVGHKVGRSWRISTAALGDFLGRSANVTGAQHAARS